MSFVAGAGCDRGKTKHSQAQQQKPAAFRDTMFTGITPTADGGAYAIGLDSGLWYLRGSQAIKVHFPDIPAEKADTFYISLQITPLMDGGAYARSIVDKSFWHLHADAAERVVEVTSLSNAPPVAPLSAFPLYVAERQQRLEVEMELEECREPEVPDPEPEWPE